MGRYEYPFSALVGQEKLKTALLPNLVGPHLGGVLIQREEGTAKSTAVRGLAKLMDEVEVMEGRLFHRRMDGRALCNEYRSSPVRRAVPYRRRVVEPPVNVTEDRVMGTLDLERALRGNVRAFETGLLAQVNGNTLYVGEINLLESHIVDMLLGSAIIRVNTVEQEGISYSHPTRFILVDIINPEEGDLWPQLLDRFDPMVGMHGEWEAEARKEVVRCRLAFKENPAVFYTCWTPEREALRRRIGPAQALLPQVSLSKSLFDTVTRVCTALQVNGHRTDITMPKIARALMALEGQTEAGIERLRRAAELALSHRLRWTPLEQAGDAGVSWEVLFYG